MAVNSDNSTIMSLGVPCGAATWPTGPDIVSHVKYNLTADRRNKWEAQHKLRT